MNEIIQAMKERRSCRKYQDTMIPKEDLEEVMEQVCMQQAAWENSLLSLLRLQTKK